MIQGVGKEEEVKSKDIKMIMDLKGVGRKLIDNL